MSSEEAGKWRRAIRRRLEVLGKLHGQALEHLPQTLDTSWFKRFMNGTTDIISRRQKEEIVLAFGQNWNARGQHHPLESLQHFSDEELLELFTIDPKLSED